METYICYANNYSILLLTFLSTKRYDYICINKKIIDPSYTSMVKVTQNKILTQNCTFH